MTVRREMSGTETFTYTQAWTIDNRLASVTKTDLTGTVLAVTTYAFDGDGARVRKDDPDGTTLYAGVMEHIIGAPGTAMAEYFDDASGPTMSAYVTTRSEPVVAGLQGSYTTTPPLPTMGDAPWAIRWQLWLTVPVTDTYTFAVQADDGFSLSGIGPALTNTTTRALTTTEASSGVVLTPGLIYNFSLAYMNYTTATTSTIQLLWRRAGGALEIVPREAIHARGRRDYYSFGGAVVAMKDGVMASVTRTLSYLHGDHLGSASLTTNASGQKVSEQRYKPYGEVRWSSGAGMPTDKQFTSQTRLAEGYVGTLYDYVARAYDPVLGRFISADTIVPGAGNGQAHNRYMYVLGNPLLLTDATGHGTCDDEDCQHVTRGGYRESSAPNITALLNIAILVNPDSSSAEVSIRMILGAYKARDLTSLDQLAYVLATAHHESQMGKSMHEWADGSEYEGREDLGNTDEGDGVRYKGRGFVQLTGKFNYKAMGTLFGVDLVKNPELATQPKLAADILVYGMTAGSYTGAKLADFASRGGFAYFDARAIVNADKNRILGGSKVGQSIANIAREYRRALSVSGIERYLLRR